MIVHFEILEHPADMGTKATGATLAEAFVNAAWGLFSVILQRTGSPETLTTKRLALKGVDREQLLVKWLSELLYLYDAERFVPVTIDLQSLSEGTCVALVQGELFDDRRHQALLDVKAITYHQLSIVERPQESTIIVFLDI